MLEAIAYNSGKDDETSDESFDRDSQYSGDAEDVDQGLDVYPAVSVDDFNDSESDKDDANEGSGK